ncbi:protein-L-isoaspartate(D-aspartate) O-methyltransferase [Chlamydiota bacterium]
MNKVKINFIAIFIISISFIISADKQNIEPDKFVTARKEMVKYQIISRGIKDRNVLSAMRTVKRHLFVPKILQNSAYRDHPLPIGDGQTISQPYIVALMSDALGLKSTDRVLEIGTGSGYQAAVLAHIVKEVYSIEIIKKLAVSAKKRLHNLGYKNIFIKHGDGYRGWPEYAPFDAIIVTCAPDKIPQPLLEQLAPKGRMVIPLADDFPQRLVLITKHKDRFEKKTITSVMFVPMTGQAQIDNK